MYLLIVGGRRAARAREAAQRLVEAAPDATPVALDAATLPFIRASRAAVTASPAALVIEDVERAFPSHQAGGTRLVLTQSTYAIQKWLDQLTPGDCVIATADGGALRRDAPEALQRRGPWAAFQIVDLSSTTHVPRADAPAPALPADARGRHVVAELLARAYASASGEDRLTLCREAAAVAPDSAVAALALASACREQQDMPGAQAAIEAAARLAPDWEAVWFEEGKVWLGFDDMERARDAFQRAADLMPAFSAAWSNLGATLGELDRPEEALTAFQQALAHDPFGFAILNNIGVVSRELGRLDESEAAFRRVVELAPEFVFGYYNHGHTLFLAGHYRQALAAYEEGQRRDPEQNRRQGCRLAVMRFANGDPAGAERDLRRFANSAPPEEREDLLVEAYEIAAAVVARHPELDPAGTFLTAIGREIA